MLTHRWPRLRPSLPSAVLACIFCSATTLALAPLLMPASYSWIEHTTSESAAQGVAGAWVARLGFTLFGLAVVMLVIDRARRWRWWQQLPHVVFATCMVLAAVFSSRPWNPGEPFDRVEDLVHSAAASVMGVAFIIGVLVAFAGANRSRRRRALDVVAVAASTIVPIVMFSTAGVAGLTQRLMFTVAYLWYALEAGMAQPRAVVKSRRVRGGVWGSGDPHGLQNR